MDVLTGGIVIFSAVAFILTISSVTNKLKYSFSRWNQLGLDDYKVISTTEESWGRKLIVEIPIGKSYDDFTKYKGQLEKAYSCECDIINLTKSQNVEVHLKTN